MTDELSTIAERSGYRITGRYEEVGTLCAEFQRRWPQAASTFVFGQTPEGRPLHALVVSLSGALTAEAAQARQLPVLLVQGGIHPGECDGKDAGFAELRDLLLADSAWLHQTVLLFVPVLNADGHERFKAWNRPNQNGPEEMGWRTTAHNLNLNRDYTKAAAPEMQAVLRLLNDWDPLVYMDLHATNGAQFEHDISIQVEPIYLDAPGLQAAGLALREGILERLSAQGSLPLPFYPSLVDDDDPASGFVVDAYGARFSTGYWAWRNRWTVLVETHSWKDYATRVRITRNSIRALCELAAGQGRDWRAQAAAADAASCQLGGQPVTLDYQNGAHSSLIDFRGYAYTRLPSAISGALATRYDDSQPAIWRVPLKDVIEPRLVERAPRGGYVVPAAYADWLGPQLSLHGLTWTRLESAPGSLPLETFRAERATLSSQTFEGRTKLAVEGSWQPETREPGAGCLFVPIAQPGARLLMTLLEPRSPDSYAAWGYFNGHFERVEYMEGYVAEQVAEEMLEADSMLADEFRKRLGSDPAFAADPKARLDFFYRRHPSWDERWNLYPIYRSDSVLSL
ncbi:MAG: M14 family zinc carboxypeptidase [Stagnimonas sp.]|nr:M14 family zinc carboxypeptidase [Stagnimonas sp.]